MKKILSILLFLLSINVAHAQTFRSNQILGNPVPLGVVMSTSTLTSSSLTASTSPNIDGTLRVTNNILSSYFTATSTTATSTFSGGMIIGNGGGTNGLTVTGTGNFSANVIGSKFQIGGTSSSFPMWINSSAIMQAQLADGSGMAEVDGSYFASFSGVGGNKTLRVGVNPAGLEMVSGYNVNWASSATVSSTGVDTSLSRLKAGFVAVGTGANGSVAGSLIANTIGISTSTPASKLHVYVSANSLQIPLIIENDQGGSGSANLGFSVVNNTTEALSEKAGIGLIRNAANGQGNLILYNRGTNDTGNFTASDAAITIGGVSSGIANVAINNTSLQYPLVVKTATDKDIQIRTGVTDSTAIALSATNDGDTLNIPMEFRASSYNFPSGNVGVGIVAASYPLEVIGAAATPPGYFGSTGGTGQIRLGNNTAANYWEMGRDNVSTGDLIFKNQAAEEVRFASGGNVGIATNNPANFKLQVAGNIGPDSNANFSLGSASNRFVNTYSSNFYEANISQGSVIFADSSSLLTQDNANFFWDASTHRLGLGTAAPTATLSASSTAEDVIDVTGGLVSGGSKYTSTYWGSQIASGKAMNFGYITNIADNTKSGAYLTNYGEGEGTSGIFVKKGGNVGIGNASPNFPLDVTGTAAGGINTSGAYTSTGSLAVNNANQVSLDFASGNGRIRNEGATTGAGNRAGFQIDIADSAGGNTLIPFLISTTGNIGISTTTPAFALDVNGIITTEQGGLYLKRNLTDAAARRNWGFVTENNQQGDFSILESTSNTSNPATTRLQINSGGNTGIGVSNPATKLSVAGNIYATTGGISSGINAGGQGQLALSDGTAGGGQVYFGTGTTQALSGSGTTLSVGGGFATTYFTGGNVGVGTTTPAYNLDVNGYEKVGGTVANISGGTSFPYLTNSGQMLIGWNQSGGQGETDFIANNGAGGSGGIKFSSYSNVGVFKDIMYLRGNDGNVGIASSTPWKTLSVVGTMAINGLTAEAGTKSTLCIDPVTFEVESNAAATCTVSSRIYKHNIQSLTTGLSEILKFRPVSYLNNDDNQKNVGLIAEEVKSIDPRLITVDSKGNPHSVKYENITAIIIKATQELNAKIDAQQKEIDELKLEIGKLKK